MFNVLSLRLTLIAAGNHWHIDCVKCNTCDRLLDPDDTLLVLRDGSHICRHCKYRCPVCGSAMVEPDLPGTGLARYRYPPFCSGCVQCRQCKSVDKEFRGEGILTPYGIFCVTCRFKLLALNMIRKDYQTLRGFTGAEGSGVYENRSIGLLKEGGELSKGRVLFFE